MAEPAERPHPAVEQHERPEGERPLDRMLAAMEGKGDLPAAARVIQRLHETVRDENCNSLDVARIILADPGLSSKVLRVVNSSFYRPRGEPISTITRAVMLLGFETIRDLAAGLVLLDEITQAAGGRAAIRAVLRRSLLCGAVARALSTTIHYPSPEEAYLLGLFANWGELSMAAYFPDEYARTTERARVEGIPLAQALTETFGLPPTALASGILARWDFPASYADYFRVPHPAGDQPVTNAGQRLFAIVDLAQDFAVRAAADPAAPVDPETVARYETMFGRRGDELRAAVARGVEEAETTPLRAATPYVSLGRAGEAKPRGAAASAPSGRAAAAADPAAGGNGDGPASGPLPAAYEILAEITRHILAEENINDTLAMVLEGIARTGPYDVAFLALLTAKKDRLVGRLGYGEGVAQYLRALDSPVGPAGGVLAECLLAREPRVVPHASAGMLGSSGAAAAIAARSFIACPLVVRGRPVGVLVVARGEGGKPVTDEDLTVVQLFCSQAALALDRAAH